MIDVKENIPLNRLTTLCTGGTARWFISCASPDDIIEALKFAKASNLEVFVLGGGSNLLISDRGFDGLVIQIALTNLTFEPKGLVTAGAGVNWDYFVETSCERGLSGIEALSGIPGLVGATPVQNVGAYGQDVSETITSVTAINRKTLDTQVFPNKDCEFSYRQSRFKSRDKNLWVISAVQLQLSETSEPNAKYDELKTSLASDAKWTLGNRLQKITAIREHVLKIRASKGMVINPLDPDTRSVGSFFVNPIVTTAIKDHVTQVALQLDASRIPVAHAAGDNLWKLSAAWLIEHSGVTKGFTLGRARISTKHVLALTNPGDGSTGDILALADHVQNAVQSTFGILLEREPVFVG
jgi:UDP-N-acetylmuramate dehydrogenase